MELKTLKDIDLGLNCKDPKRELKAEAVKWVKEMRAKGSRGYVDGVCINQCDEYSCTGIEDFIKHFFNLTEEDLE